MIDLSRRLTREQLAGALILIPREGSEKPAMYYISSEIWKAGQVDSWGVAGLNELGNSEKKTVLTPAVVKDVFVAWCKMYFPEWLEEYRIITRNE